MLALSESTDPIDALRSLAALLTLEQQGGAAGRLAQTRVRQLLQTRASADACGAWRPLSRWPLALQAFVSQVRAASLMCVHPKSLCFYSWVPYRWKAFVS